MITYYKQYFYQQGTETYFYVLTPLGTPPPHGPCRCNYLKTLSKALSLKAVSLKAVSLEATYITRSCITKSCITRRADDVIAMEYDSLVSLGARTRALQEELKRNIGDLRGELKEIGYGKSCYLRWEFNYFVQNFKHAGGVP